MGWQSYHHVVVASTPDEAFARARDQVDDLVLPHDVPSGTILEQTGYEVVALPTVDDLSDDERGALCMGIPYARTQAFERRLAASDRARSYVRTSYRSWVADLGDGTMVAFGWAHAG